MKKIALFIGIIFTLVVMKSEEAHIAYAEWSWEQEEFIISTFQGVGGDYGYYPALMYKMKELGLNTAEMYFRNRQDSLAALNAADNVGMNVIVNELGDEVPYVNRFSNFQNKIYGLNTDAAIQDAIAYYSGHPSLYGYAVWDEPFPENIGTAKSVMNKFKMAVPDKLALIGALPHDVSGTFNSQAEWRDYIDQYTDQIDMQLLAIDYYPFAEVDAGTPLEETKLFANLGYMRQKALEKQIPLWVYIQSVGDLQNTTIGSMTADKIRLQAYYSLAYGAKAISYYNVRSGLLTDTAQETNLFQDVKSLNEALQKLGPTLLSLSSTGVYQTGQVYNPYDNDIKDQSLVKSLPNNMILGTFVNEQHEVYILPVNRSYSSSLSNTISFYDIKDVYELDKYTGNEVLIASDVTSFDINFLPGEGGLYRIVNKSTPTSLKMLNDGGQTIFDPTEVVDYRISPAIIMDSDHSIKMWLQAPGQNNTWESIVYRQSIDNGLTWSNDEYVLEATNGSEDQYCVSEPSVVKLGSYYYMTYTGCGTVTGMNRDVFVARATSANGPFLKWDGSSWGVGAPKPLLQFTGPVDKPGIWGSSMVVHNNKLYIYYQLNGVTTESMVAIVDNPYVDSWPTTLQHHQLEGLVYNEYVNDEAAEFKYIDQLNKFIAISTYERFTDAASVSIWQSDDGIQFERAIFQGERVQSGAHNIGISGNSLGHIDLTQNNFIVYGYQRNTDPFYHWPTYKSSISIDLVESGTYGVGAFSSSIFNHWWSAPKLIDGNLLTGWSSEAMSQAIGKEQWATIDLGKPYLVSAINVMPNTGGKGFPISFELQYSYNQNDWVTFNNGVYHNYMNPGNTLQSFQLDVPIYARYLRMVGHTFSTDGSDTYYMQLGEISATTIR